MNIWLAREKSIKWLNDELKPEGIILQEGFDYLGNFINLFEEIGRNEGKSETGHFCRIISLTLAKFSHLLLGCYSLTLDGLAQESGALLRPLIETYELLVYFRQDNTRLNQVIEDKLPSAGEIGKRISGDYHSLRTYLNDNASHFSYKMDSVRHLFDNNFKIQPVPNHNLKVFRKNILILNAFQIFALREAQNCLFVIEYDAAVLTNAIEKWCDTCKEVFPPEQNNKA